MHTHQAEEPHQAIRGSPLAVRDGAAHLANVEAPGPCSAPLRRFLLS